MKEVEYKGIKIKVEKISEKDYRLDCESEKTPGKSFSIYCNDDSEKNLEKMYKTVKNDGPLVFPK